MDHSFENVLLWHNALHVLDQVVGIGGLVILQVVNNQVESGFWDHIDQWWQNLKGILTTSKDDQVVSE